MKRPLIALAGTVWILIVMVGWKVVRAADPALDTAKIEQLTGAKGELNIQEGVFKVSVPRSDLAVTVAGVKMTPPLGLTSWAAFQPMGTQTMVMGDLVLLEDQVNPVMSVALTNGIEVTALHNHFFWDSPKVMSCILAAWAAQRHSREPWGKCLPPLKRPAGARVASRMRSLSPSKPPWIPKQLKKSWV